MNRSELASQGRDKGETSVLPAEKRRPRMEGLKENEQRSERQEFVVSGRLR